MIKVSLFRTVRDQIEDELKSSDIPNLKECEIHFQINRLLFVDI